MIRPIIKAPNPILKQVSKRINEINNEIRNLANDLIETMINANGVGLSAVQVGEPINMIAVLNNDLNDLIDSHEYPVLIALNPQITWESQETVKWSEGCLSFDHLTKRIRRPESIKVEYTDLKGKRKEVLLKGRNARIFEHECDHLIGRTLADYE